MNEQGAPKMHNPYWFGWPPAYFFLGFLGFPRYFGACICTVHYMLQDFPYFTLKHWVEWEGDMNVTFWVPTTFYFLTWVLVAHRGSVCINWLYTHDSHSFNMWYFNNKFPPQNTHNTQNNLENDKKKVPIIPLYSPSVHSRFCANVFLFLCPPSQFSHLTLCNKHFPASWMLQF